MDGQVDGGRAGGRAGDGWEWPLSADSLQLGRTACTISTPPPPRTSAGPRALHTTLGPAGAPQRFKPRDSGFAHRAGKDALVARTGCRALAPVSAWTLSLGPPASLRGPPLGFRPVGTCLRSYHDGLGLLGVQLGDSPAEALGLRRGGVGGGHGAGEVRAPSPQPSARWPL